VFGGIMDDQTKLINKDKPEDENHIKKWEHTEASSEVDTHIESVLGRNSKIIYILTTGVLVFIVAIFLIFNNNGGETMGNYADTAEQKIDLTTAKQNMPLPTSFELPTAYSVLATYGEHTISAGYFLYWLRTNINREENFFLPFTDELPEGYWRALGPDGRTNMERIREDTLEEVLNHNSILILAREGNHTYDLAEREELRQHMENDAEYLRIQGLDPEELFYDAFGITINFFENIQSDILVWHGFITSLGINFHVSDEDISNFISLNYSYLESWFGLNAHVVHILVSTNNLSTREMREAQIFAEEILARLNAGEDPRVLAATYSYEAASPDGSHSFTRGVMLPQFEEWAFNAAPGDTGIVKTVFGFHVMFSEGRDDLNNHTEEIIGIVREEKALEIISEILRERNIDWEIDYQLLELLF